MKKIFYSLLLVTTIGCTNDLEIPLTNEADNGKADSTVTLTAVIDGTLTRTYLDSENYVCWMDGDRVWINGATYTVDVDGDNAVINGVAKAEHYACVYPANVASDLKDECKVKIELPATQTINFDASGKQILNLPMAAYGDGSSPLTFRNLCGLIAINLTNTDKDDGMTVSSISLSTTGDVDFIAPLYGKTWAARNLSSDNYAEDWAILASNIGGQDSEDKRHIDITVNSAPVIAKNSSAKYYITVPVIDNGTKSNLSVRIGGSMTGGYSWSFNKTTPGTKQIGRNQIGNIPVSSTLCYVSYTGNMQGAGTAQNPYLISTADHFKAIATMVRNGEVTSSTHFLQINDIDFGGSTIVPVGELGMYLSKDGTKLNYFYSPFSGTYDGSGYELSNFTIWTGVRNLETERRINMFIAPFGYVAGGTVKNLTVDNSITLDSYSTFNEETGPDYTGYTKPSLAGIVGCAGPQATLSNLRFTGSLSYTINEKLKTKESVPIELWYLRDTYLGGLVGCLNEAGSIDHAIFDGSISVNSEKSVDSAGGIAAGGLIESVSYCNDTPTAKVQSVTSSPFDIGGLFGNLSISGNLSHCRFTGLVDCTGTHKVCDLGGMFGRLEFKETASCATDLETTSTARISFSTVCPMQGLNGYIGGLVGHLYSPNSTMTISGLVNRMSFSVSGDEDSYGWTACAGGIAGLLSVKTPAEMTNFGEITISETIRPAYVGGIAGYVEGLGTSGAYCLVNNAALSASSKEKETYCGGIFGYVDIPTSDKAELTGCSNGANIMSQSDASCSYAGGIAGLWNDGTAQVSEFANTGTITANSYNTAYAGGLFGYIDCDYATSITNCSNTKAVSATATYQGNVKAYAGGIAGYWNDRALDISVFTNSGSVEANAYGNAFAGGCFGLFDGYSPVSHFESVTNTAEVNSYSGDDYAYAGGLAAFMDGSSDVVIINKFHNTGAIKGYAKGDDEARVGGLVGEDTDAGYDITLEIFNSVNEGNVTAISDGDHVCVGGFIGCHDSNGATYWPCIINCNNRGNIRATTPYTIYAGGFIGYCYDTYTEIGCSYCRCYFHTDGTCSKHYLGGLSGTAFKNNHSFWNTFTGNTLDVVTTYEGSGIEAWKWANNSGYWASQNLNEWRSIAPESATIIYGEKPGLIQWSHDGHGPKLVLP